MRFFTYLAALAFLLPAYAGAAERTPVMVTAGITSIPRGHFEFCMTHRAECSVVTITTPRVKLTQELLNQLVAVNRTVNAAIRPMSDQEIYGKEDVWAYPDKGVGDCEDYALLKRRDLIKKGWPVGALLLTMVKQPNNEAHVVLTVLTDQGDLVLDELVGSVRVWSETPYTYIKRQDWQNSGWWVDIVDPGPAPAVISSVRK